MVLEEMSKCTGCGKPRFTPGLCQECQEKTGLSLAIRNTTQVYNLIGEASDLLTGLYDYNSNRVDEIANKLAEAQEQALKAEHQIRELQTQLNLQKGINAEQQKKLDEIKEYSEQLRWSHSIISGELRRMLKLESCPNCGQLVEKCSCPNGSRKCYICGKDSGNEIYCSQNCSDYSNGKRESWV